MIPRASWQETDDAGYALNFYSPMVADQLRSGPQERPRPSGLGDKSPQVPQRQLIVQVLAGNALQPRGRKILRRG